MIHVIYHKNCADGIASAWVARKYLESRINTDPTLKQEKITYYAMQYGDFPPQLESNDEVYIVDFSFSRDILDTLWQVCPNITVIDHHKTAEEQLKGSRVSSIFSLTESACVLTWRHFFPDKSPPTLLRYIQDRDLWKWELPNSREISACVASYEFTLDNFEMLMNRNPTEMVKEGAAIERYKQQQIKSILENKHKIEIKIPIDGIFDRRQCNAVCSCVHQSELGHELAISDIGSIGAVYFRNNAGNYVVSLRSIGDVDVSAIAKFNDGGGHKNAAGFTCKEIIVC